MLRDVRITYKLPLVMVLFALLSALVGGVVAYSEAASSMEKQAKERLYALLESRESAVIDHFDDVRSDVRFHARSGLVKQALQNFSAAWAALPEEKERYVQRKYIDNNPFPSNKRSHLLAAKDGSTYSEVHEKNHPDFTSIITAGSYYDVFLVDPNGNVIYTNLKEADFGTNLKETKWSESGLADTFDALMKTPTPDQIAFSDFSKYQPSKGRIASFVGTPVYDSDNQLLGIFAVQLAIDKMDKVMQVTAGMGTSGETYLVGQDKLMRSNSRFFGGRSILKISVDTVPTRSALRGEEGVTKAQDYRDISVFSAFKPIDVMGKPWAILAEIDEAEVLKPVHELSRSLTIAGLILTLAIALIGFLLSRDLSVPIRSMTEVMGKLANNDLSVNISVDERRDEVGEMAQALVVFREMAREREKLREHLSYLANHDSLTGLPNRSFILDYIRKKMDESDEAGGGFTVMFADLDHFKQINDQFGHLSGNEVLKKVSERIKYSLRDGDILGRIGGDEFLIVLSTKATDDDVQSIAQKIIKNVSAAFEIKLDISVSVGVSIGSANYPENKTLDELLHNADNAMYAAKADGRNCVKIHQEVRPD